MKPLAVLLSLSAALAIAHPASLALAQTPPPMKREAAPKEEVASRTVSIAEKAQKCLEIEDANDRATCYDAAVKPQPKPNPPPVRGIRDCSHMIDINERLACFDNFASQIPKFTH